MMEWGTLFDCQAGHVLAISQAIESFEAVCDHPLYEFIELRYIDQNSRRSEIVIVDCVTHVASRNQAGIKHKERLALCFFEQAKIRPEVRSLREDFPATWHQNHVLEGEPASLCFELSEWALSRRSWTAAKFLRQILVWLQETASGMLHKNEQPLEPFFFENRRCRLVLPADYDEKIDTEEWSLRVAPKNIYRDEYETFSSVFIHNGESSQDGLDFHTIAIRTPTVLHGRVEHTPHKLGELHDQLAGRGVDLAKLMYESLRQQSEGVGIAASNKKFTLLVLSIPLSRDAEMVAEKIHTRGFILSESLESIGTRSGVLRLHEEKYRFTPTIGADGFTRDDWREVIINPIFSVMALGDMISSLVPISIKFIVTVAVTIPTNKKLQTDAKDLMENRPSPHIP